MTLSLLLLEYFIEVIYQIYKDNEYNRTRSTWLQVVNKQLKSTLLNTVHHSSTEPPDSGIVSSSATQNVVCRLIAGL